MNITFIGHSIVIEPEKIENKLINILKEIAVGKHINFYLGGYGQFDDIARKCCYKLKKQGVDCKLIFVTPYLNESYIRNKTEYQLFDEIEFPNIESTPKRFAIVKRNYYMIETADIVIAYIYKTWGGAFRSYEYAKRKNKIIYNIYKKE